MKRLVGSLTASWRNLASNLRHCTRSFIVTSWEMHFPRHIRPVLTTKSLRFGAYILRASLTAIRFSLPRQLRFPTELSNHRHQPRRAWPPTPPDPHALHHQYRPPTS